MGSCRTDIDGDSRKAAAKKGKQGFGGRLEEGQVHHESQADQLLSGILLAGCLQLILTCFVRCFNMHTPDQRAVSAKGAPPGW